MPGCRPRRERRRSRAHSGLKRVPNWAEFCKGSLGSSDKWPREFVWIKLHPDNDWNFHLLFY